MEFHKHKGFWETWSSHKRDGHESPLDFLTGKPEDVLYQAACLMSAKLKEHGIVERIGQQNFYCMQQESQHLLSEATWWNKRRPFYNVYPCVAEMVDRVSLDIPLNKLDLPSPSLVICYPKGLNRIKTVMFTVLSDVLSSEQVRNHIDEVGEYELPKEDIEQIRERLREMEKGGKLLFVAVQISRKDEPPESDKWTLCRFQLQPTFEEETIQQMLDISSQNPCGIQWDDRAPSFMDGRKPNSDPDGVVEAVTRALRIYVAICMLADDVRFVQPIILPADMASWRGATEEARRRMLDRAAKHYGGTGYTFGQTLQDLADEAMAKRDENRLKKDLHVPTGKKRKSPIPHSRTWYLFTTWTGKGKTIPEIRFEGPKLVGGHEVYKVPTGYLGDKPDQPNGGGPKFTPKKRGRKKRWERHINRSQK